jgi:hypothetical protein
MNALREKWEKFFQEADLGEFPLKSKMIDDLVAEFLTPDPPRKLLGFYRRPHDYRQTQVLVWTTARIYDPRPQCVEPSWFAPNF